MTQSFAPQLPVVKSIPPLRQILVIEPMQQHLGLQAVLLPVGTQCSIGSSRACTLTVRAQGIFPQHCLIVSGPNSTILKEFSESTWLNDRPIRSPIELIENDRLAVGPTEFRVRVARPEEIESAVPLVDLNNQSIQSQVGTHEMLRQREELSKTQQHLASEVERLRDREFGLKQKETELNDRFEELDQKLRLLSARDDGPAGDAVRELDARVLELISGGDDVTKQRATLDQQRQQLEAARRAHEQQEQVFRLRDRDYQEKQAAIANAELALEHRRNEFTAREQEVERLRRSFLDQQQEQVTRQREFDRRQAELEKQRQAIDQLRGQSAQSGGVFGSREIAATRMLLDAERSELSVLREQIERQRVEFEKRRDEFQTQHEAASRNLQSAAARTTELEAREKRLAQQTAELAARDREVQERLKQVAAQSESTPGDVQERAQHEEQLRRLAESLREREKTLREQADRYNGDIVQWQTELESQRSMLDQRLTEATRKEDFIATRTRELAERERALVAELSKVERKAVDRSSHERWLLDQDARLQGQRDELADRQSQLQKQQDEFEAKRAEFETAQQQVLAR